MSRDILPSGGPSSLFNYLLTVDQIKSDLSRYKKVRVVLGNPSCDLDSVVSAHVQAFIELHKIQNECTKDIAVIPVLNILRSEIHLKTEVIIFLKDHDFSLHLLTFRDDINLIGLKQKDKLELILVDHHNLSHEDISLKDSVIKIIDHRPQDPTWPWPDIEKILEPVGSCASLVTRNVFEEAPELLNIDPQPAGNALATFLRGPILIDTFNLSKEAGVATALDYAMVEKLELYCALKPREETYRRLLAAKRDISQLTVDELLRRDLKIDDDIHIPFIGFPLLVETYLGMTGAHEAIVEYAESKTYHLMIFLGYVVHENDKIERDLAIFWLPGYMPAERICNILLESKEPYLDLQWKTEIDNILGKRYKILLYRQGNVHATRKPILSMVRRMFSPVVAKKNELSEDNKNDES